jgi:hypothetical protein
MFSLKPISSVSMFGKRRTANSSLSHNGYAVSAETSPLMRRLSQQPTYRKNSRLYQLAVISRCRRIRRCGERSYHHMDNDSLQEQIRASQSGFRIQIGAGAAHRRYAQAIGKSADDLTDQERAQAILHAYLSVDLCVVQPWDDKAP